jgi:hypothetical protein
MTNDTGAADIAKLAAGLTEQQRRVLLAFDKTGLRRFGQPQIQVAVQLTKAVKSRAPLIEACKLRTGGMRSYVRVYRPTALGRQVRAHLEASHEA